MIDFFKRKLQQSTAHFPFLTKQNRNQTKEEAEKGPTSYSTIMPLPYFKWSVPVAVFIISNGLPPEQMRMRRKLEERRTEGWKSTTFERNQKRCHWKPTISTPSHFWRFFLTFLASFAFHLFLLISAFFLAFFFLISFRLHKTNELESSSSYNQKKTSGKFNLSVEDFGSPMLLLRLGQAIWGPWDTKDTSDMWFF